KPSIDTHANQVLKTKIDASVGMARSVVHSWLPLPKEGEPVEEEEEEVFAVHTLGRPDRLGLGAKFLSHADAMRHTPTPTGSKQENQLRSKILGQNQRHQQNQTNKNNKRE
ncbi:hypothetical protein BDF14DRAFT_1696225, partial [Spinellus fusiger]